LIDNANASADAEEFYAVAFAQPFDQWNQLL
jgi:hypothetical protein